MPDSLLLHLQLRVAGLFWLPNLGQQLVQLLYLHLPCLLEVLVEEGVLHLLGLPPEVGRELEALDRPAAVADDDDGVLLVEADVVQPRLLLGHDGLDADGGVLVDVQVVDVHLAVQGDGGEDGAGVRGPGHVAHLGVEVEHEERLPEVKMGKRLCNHSLVYISCFLFVCF